MYWKSRRSQRATSSNKNGCSSKPWIDIGYLGTKEVAEIDALGVHVTLVDHLGSPRVTIGPNGAIEAEQKYLPFGERLDFSGSLKTAKGFTNHEQTDASGLIYMQARFYAPMYHRFLSPDPGLDQHFEMTQSWNIYSYVQNSPVMMTDPTGMFGGPFTNFIKQLGQATWDTLTTHNPLYQAAAQVQDTVFAGANSAFGTDLPMTSKLGQDAANGADASQMVWRATEGPTQVMAAAVVGRGLEIGFKLPSETLTGPVGELPSLGKGAPKTGATSPSSGRPNGVPENWEASPAKGEGTVYRDPANPKGNIVRDMKGNPNSPNPAQQKPYVTHVKNGVTVDVNGKPIQAAKPSATVEAHIPRDKFKLN